MNACRPHLLAVWVLLASVALLPLMPTGESLWMDEADTACYVAQPDFSHWLALLRSGSDSTTQMPLCMAAFWVWGRLFGAGEWALRSINLLWGAAALLALFVAGRRLRLPWLPLGLAVHPFLWSYMNEARPYAMQIAAAAWLMAGLAVCFTGGEKRARWAWMAAPSAVVVFGANMLGGAILAAVGLALIVALARRRTWPSPGAWTALALGGILCLLLAWYYKQTLAAGNGGARLWSVGAANIAFAAYELFGFDGMGPGRLDLRAAARDGGGALVAMLRPYALSLVALTLAWLGVVLAAFATPHRRSSRGLACALAAVAGLAALFLFAAALIAGFPFWGRHLAPLLPFLVTVAVWAAAGLRGKALWRGALPVALLGLLLLSSALLRIAPRHRKEDNRASAKLAATAARAGLRVWWSASGRTAAYYGLSLTTLDAAPSNAICNAANLPVSIASAVLPPDLVFVCKPDVFDEHGSLAAYLAAHAYRPERHLPGFVLWKHL